LGDGTKTHKRNIGLAEKKIKKESQKKERKMNSLQGKLGERNSGKEKGGIKTKGQWRYAEESGKSRGRKRKSGKKGKGILRCRCVTLRREYDKKNITRECRPLRSGEEWLQMMSTIVEKVHWENRKFLASSETS